MAIIVEDNRQSGVGIVSVAIWLVLLAIVAAGVYYVFFKKPEIITVAPPRTFKDAQNVAKIKLDIEPVISKLNPPHFDTYIPVFPASTTGRTNPFLGL